MTIALALCALCARAADSSGRLWIGVEGANPPYHFVGSDRKLAGMEVEIAAEICRRIRKVCVFRITGWEELKPALLDGRIDFIASSLEIPRRASAKFTYSEPIYRIPWSYVVNRASPEIARAGPDAPGLRIGVEKDGPAPAFLARRHPRAEAVAFGSRVDALLELSAGRVPMVLMRRDHADRWLNSTPEGRCCRILANAEDDVGLIGRGVGLAFRGADAALKDSADSALRAMREDGTLREIIGRWQLFEMM